MKRIAMAILVTAGLGLPTTLAADSRPPADALPLSMIVQALEGEGNVDYITEVEWDDGRWEIEYVSTDGREMTVRADPVTGERHR